jgi:4-amino-4-deoxy-L-arabinose transferase-like glycosyltransferase
VTLRDFAPPLGANSRHPDASAAAGDLRLTWKPRTKDSPRLSLLDFVWPTPSSWARVAILLLLALAFQGTRGLWEPDEGFYANAALGMVDSGDYLVPRLNGAPFLDKPPLVYWVQAAGVRLVGRSEWGLRLGHALLFLCSAALVGASARRASPSTGVVDGSLLYATLPLAFLAANVLTPDTPLAFGLALALYGLVRLETRPAGESSCLGWIVTGLGFAVALLAKGPAALPFAAAALAHRALGGRLRATVSDKWAWAGVGLALAPAVAWYGAIALRLPGSGDYLLDQQVVGRLLSSHLERNAGWSGAIRVYFPTLLVGLAPWALYATRHLWTSLPRAWQGRLAGTPRGRVELLLVLWTFLPLVVFFAASSRLPLYVLPLAAPVAALAHLALEADSPMRGNRRQAVTRGLVVVALALLSVKAGASYLDNYRDSRGMAKELAAILPSSIHRVISIDVNRNGLALYHPDGIEWVTKDPTPYPFYSPLETFAEEIAEIAACPRSHALIVARRDVDEVLSALTQAGQYCRVETLPHFNPVLLCTPATLPTHPVPDH